MNKQEIEATTKLAEAMSKLADRLEKFQDPVFWQKVWSDAIGQIPGLAPPSPVLIGRPVPLPPGEAPVQSGAIAVEGITISLSDDERQKLVNQVNEAIQPQLAELSQFVKDSLQDMPAHRLKRLAEKVAAGEKPTLKRRHGCVYIAVADEEMYLGL